MSHRFFPSESPRQPGAHLLGRRGYAVGWVRPAPPSPAAPTAFRHRWRTQHAIHLPGWVDTAPLQPLLRRSERWVEGVLLGEEWETLLETLGLLHRLKGHFQWLATVFDDSDPQAIARLDFAPGNAPEQEVWLKASWLSLHEDDPSLRFRFSHGLDRYEDVAADPRRQTLSSALCELFFPESETITGHQALAELLSQHLGGAISYVERIVYFNAPNGGAQFHQDVERGHAGVVYAQLSGETFWFALPKTALMAQFAELFRTPPAREELVRLVGEGETRRLEGTAADPAALDRLFDDPEEEALHVALNRSSHLARGLVNSGFGYHLRPGDVLLLPQHDLQQCCWHSVFCLGEVMGEALSFAIRVD